ncbi:hypothetical protein B0T14DRAFT_65178 [Immersiella caudata]|uniref:Uncharacterized protein n=1 Tax=Immersiella caudata TaxID=314043 RepID=A0AA40CCH0_9PEZI|nr:hypothetical protein B0T14DRAFT_65178 [Immersiella caudata]
MARSWYIFRTSRGWRYDTTIASRPMGGESARYPSFSLGEGEERAVTSKMPFRRAPPALRPATPPGGASFRTTLSDSAVPPHSYPLYGETDEYDDGDSALAFDDEMCVTIEQRPFQHGTSQIFTISNACLAAEADALPISPNSEGVLAILDTTPSPKRRLSTKISSVFSASSICQKPTKRPRLQESESPYPAEPMYDPYTDFFVISSIPTSQMRAYSPGDVMSTSHDGGRRPRAKSSPRAASRRVLQAAMRPIAAIKRRCGAKMGTRKGEMGGKEKGSKGLGKGKGTKCVAVGA